ncbi:MAG: M20 family metallo-hydrolase, partial [Intestinibacillus sp.]
WTGSHIDTVPNAGMFDGMAGVVAGMEAVRLLQERGATLRRSLTVVVYMSEEPTRFGLSCLGSRILAGDLTAERTASLRDAEGNSLYEMLDRLGFVPNHFKNVVKKPGEVYAFIELHIEQGNRLEKLRKPIGLVTAICAPTNLTVTVTGEQSHAGGTSMEDRRDAMMASAEISLLLEHLAQEASRLGSYTTGTVGLLQNIPGAVNVIPGKTIFSIDIRGVDFAVKDRMLAELRGGISEIARRRGITADLALENHDRPMICDSHVLDILRDACGETPYAEVISGAYHDSLFVSRFVPTAMLFVPSRGGISHSPEEWTDFVDIARGADILADALERLANEV